MPLYCRCAGDFELTFPAKVPTLTYIIQLSEESDIQHFSHVLFFPPPLYRTSPSRSRCFGTSRLTTAWASWRRPSTGWLLWAHTSTRALAECYISAACAPSAASAATAPQSEKDCLMVCRQEAGDAGWKIWRLCWTVDIFALMMSSWNYVCVNFRYWLLIKMFPMCFNCEPEGLCCSSVSLSAVKEKSVNILSGVPLCVPSLISGHILSELPPHLAANVSAVACAQLVTWSAPTAPQWKRIRQIWWCTIASRRAFHSCGGCEDSLDCHVWEIIRAVAIFLITVIKKLKCWYHVDNIVWVIHRRF